MGRPAISTRWMTGSSTVRGKLARTRETASLTSLRARSVLVSSRNVTVVLEIPSVTEDVMWWAPSMPETASSTVLVTCDSSSAGAAPNCVIVTEMTGTSTFGSCVIGSLLKVRYPSATSAAAITRGGSGCRIDQAEKLTAISAPLFQQQCERNPVAVGAIHESAGAACQYPTIRAPGPIDEKRGVDFRRPHRLRYVKFDLSGLFFRAVGAAQAYVFQGQRSRELLVAAGRGDVSDVGTQLPFRKETRCSRNV